MSTANGHGPYISQNGNYASQMRKQYSTKQNSSFGHGHAHNMAVMVLPNKVDYSVTKGGIRLWAVLFVFIFLCSAMLTVFTEVDDDDDNHPVHSSSTENLENDDEETIETVTRINDDDEDDNQTRESNPPDPGPQNTVIEEDDEDNDDDDEEESMLAKLREKASRFLMRKSRKQTSKDNDDDDNEDKPTTKRQPRKRRKKVEVVEEEDEEEEENEVKEEKEEEQEEEEEEEPKPVKKQRRRRRKQRKIEEDDEKNEEEEIHKDENKRKNDDDNDISEDDKQVQKHHDDDDDEDDEDDDDDGPIPTAQPPKRKPGKVLKKKVSSWKRSINNDDESLPRKNLLKHQKKKPRQHNMKNISDDDVNDDNDDNDDNDNEDEMNNTENEEIGETKKQTTTTQEVTSPRKKGTQYNRKAITNRDDYKHRTTLDSADYFLEKHEFSRAQSLYQQVINKNKLSPRAHFGLGRILQLQSEFEGNESLLDDAINEYQIVLEEDDTPETLYRIVAENIIECARYRGNLHKVLTTQRLLIDRFPEDLDLQNNFGVTFLMMGRIDDARNVFLSILETNPLNSYAQAYYGYILKVYDNEVEKGIQYMRKGLRLSTESIIDAKFYFHLGDGLMRLGRNSEAMKVYEEATHLGLFPSPLQRSFHNLDGLIGRPWWTLDQTGCGKYLKHIERQWTIIREEALNLLNKNSILFETENIHWTDGIQHAFYLTNDTNFNEKNCKLTPKTCLIFKKFSESTECFKGNLKISILYSGSRIWPHCGPTNYILEAQLGLQVPSEARIRVGNDIKGWKTGKMIVFDESFEHEIWFDGAPANSKRIVLSMNLWHPQVPSSSRFDPIRG